MDRYILESRDLITGYGKRQVLSGVSIKIAAGEIVAVVGRNGAGKSTLLRALFGLLPVWRGEIVLEEAVVRSPNPRQFLRAGITYVPQGARVFPRLTVQENLELGWDCLEGKPPFAERIRNALVWFPSLKDRLGHRAGTLSGGEKQMLALASIVVSSPRLVLLDEPSLGLAPSAAKELLARIGQLGREYGMAAIVVEQKIAEVLKIAHRMYVLRNGLVSHEGPASDILRDSMLRGGYL